MAEVQTPQIQRQLARAFQIPGPIVVDVATTVAPTILVGPDAKAGYGTTRWRYRSITVQAGAGVTGVCGLVNPASSLELLVVVGVFALTTNAAGQEFFIGPTFGVAALPAVTLPWNVLDLRESLSPNTIFTDNTISGPLAGEVHTGPSIMPPLAAGASGRMPTDNIVLAPNTALVVHASAFNLSYYVGFLGYSVEIGAK